jgi:predicted nucleotidyltransferase
VKQVEVLNLKLNQSALENYFASQNSVILAYLYGSQARRTANLLSDVDIAVLLECKIAPEVYFDIRLRITGDLMEILHSNEVDVAILNQAQPALKYQVLLHGLALYERNRDEMIGFRVRTLNEYLDFKPILQRHEQAVLEKARKGELTRGYDPDSGALERYRQLRERLEETAKPKL